MSDDDPVLLPAPIRLLEYPRWKAAHAAAVRMTQRHFASFDQPVRDKLLDPDIDRHAAREMINVYADDLARRGSEASGLLALSWRMLACDPRRPETFVEVMPALSWLIGETPFESVVDDQAAHDRAAIWWRAAAGEWAKSEDSTFRIAFIETEFPFIADHDDDDNSVPPSAAIRERADKMQQGPSVVVMHGDRAIERGLPQAWQEMRNQELPLIVARDVARLRDTLHREYPHALQTINLMLRDLREGQPVRMQPMLLVGQPGSGKSRLVRRLAELLSIYVYRFDGASAIDATFGGSPKAWSTAQPSAPARAIMMARSANPIVMVDEIEKAATSTYNGNLWNSMMPLLERETAARHRETGIDAELDLSHVNHIATANSVTALPGPLRDRFRIVQIPSPTIAHLPALAAQVMRDLAADDELRQHDEPLAADELVNIGRAWAQEKFSMRKLQRMVVATLEARDFHAPRH